MFPSFGLVDKDQKQKNQLSNCIRMVTMFLQLLLLTVILLSYVARYSENILCSSVSYDW